MTPSKRRRQGREAWFPGATDSDFRRIFPPSTALHADCARMDYRNGWEQARLDHERREEEERPQREAEEAAERAFDELRILIGDDAARCVDELIKARVAGFPA